MLCSTVREVKSCATSLHSVWGAIALYVVACNSVGIVIVQSTYIKLNVIRAFISSMSHSVACTKVIRLLK